MKTLFTLLTLKKILHPRKISRSFQKKSAPLVILFIGLSRLMVKLNKYLSRKKVSKKVNIVKAIAPKQTIVTSNEIHFKLNGNKDVLQRG